jgi:hypothetical protein
MTFDRERVRTLVREELERRLPAAAPESHPALVAILIPADESAECSDDAAVAVRRPCIIEPDRPCYNSGYCKRLGY